MIAQVSHQHGSTEGKAAMSAGHGVHVERFTAGSGLALESFSVPGGPSELKPVMTVRLVAGGMGAGGRFFRLSQGWIGAEAEGGEYGSGQECGCECPMRVACDS